MDHLKRKPIMLRISVGKKRRIDGDDLAPKYVKKTIDEHAQKATSQQLTVAATTLPPSLATPQACISTIATEIQLLIFGYLDPIDSTCLGLSSKYLYAIHRRNHGSVPLYTREENEGRARFLGTVLEGWAGKDMVWNTLYFCPLNRTKHKSNTWITKRKMRNVKKSIEDSIAAL